MYSGDELYGDEVTSPIERPMRQPTCQDTRFFDGLHARTVTIDTPEGKRFIAQVNLNGNWHDVVDYRAEGRMERTRKLARQFAEKRLNPIALQWEKV
jgi:hypothetical protein